MFRYLNYEEDCLFLDCRRKKRKGNILISPKVELRQQDYTKLGLTPDKDFCCAKHFSHATDQFADQFLFVIEHGFLAEGAYLKKSFSHYGLKKSVLLRASQFAANLEIGNEVILLQNVTKDVLIGEMSSISNQHEKPKQEKNLAISLHSLMNMTICTQVKYFQ